MLWVDQEYKYTCFQRLAMNILKQGVIPCHISFIMDGNRRYAVSQGLQKTEGHKHGFSKLAEVLRWCYDFGIKEVTVYAFSVENFKRPENEVMLLMDLALDKLNELVNNKAELDKQGIKVRVLGNIRLLPKKVQHTAAKIMLLTKGNSKATLNILMPYTTRDELTSALNMIRRGVQMGILEEEDISPEVIDRSSQLRGCLPLDLLVRTSGAMRLSDCMLWQASRSASLFSFLKVNWPALSFWHLAIALLHYQFNRSTLLPLPEGAVHHLIGLVPSNITNSHNGTRQPITVDVVEVENRRRRLEIFYARLEQEYMEELVEMTNSPEVDKIAA